MLSGLRHPHKSATVCLFGRYNPPKIVEEDGELRGLKFEWRIDRLLETSKMSVAVLPRFPVRTLR